MTAIQISTGTADDIHRLEPLWVGVHHHHQRVMPQLAPYVDDRTTWQVRRDLYIALFERRDTTLLLAETEDPDDRLVGYALGYFVDPSESWLDDTWETGVHVAEVESLAVAPNHRGQGIGTALLRELETRLRAAGATDLIIGMLPGNTAALRLYTRFGYQPTWLYMSKLDGRPRLAPHNPDQQ